MEIVIKKAQCAELVDNELNTKLELPNATGYRCRSIPQIQVSDKSSTGLRMQAELKTHDVDGQPVDCKQDMVTRAPRTFRNLS